MGSLLYEYGGHPYQSYHGGLRQICTNTINEPSLVCPAAELIAALRNPTWFERTTVGAVGVNICRACVRITASVQGRVLFVVEFVS